jgi:hypothetical protein
MSAPIYILNKNAQREQGKKAQAANIKAAKVSIIRDLAHRISRSFLRRANSSRNAEYF